MPLFRQNRIKCTACLLNTFDFDCCEFKYEVDNGKRKISLPDLLLKFAKLRALLSLVTPNFGTLSLLVPQSYSSRLYYLLFYSYSKVVSLYLSHNVYDYRFLYISRSGLTDELMRLD